MCRAQRAMLPFTGSPGYAGGEHDRKTCAVRIRVARANLSAVLLHNAVADAQPESGALADTLGGIERIEHAPRLGCSRSTVLNFHHHAVISRRGANPDTAFPLP